VFTYFLAGIYYKHAFLFLSKDIVLARSVMIIVSIVLDIEYLYLFPAASAVRGWQLRETPAFSRESSPQIDGADKQIVLTRGCRCAWHS